MHPLLQRVSSDKPRRLLISTWGLNKVGKTHLALGFPEPIVVFNTDLSLQDIAWKFPMTEVYTLDMVLPPKASVTDATNLLDQLEIVLDDTCRDLESQGKGTIVLDTASAIWQMVQKVELQPHKEAKARRSNADPDAVRVMQFQYADANLRMSSILRRVVPCEHVSAVFIHGASAIYDAGGNDTGELGLHGWKAVHGVSQFTIRQYTRETQFWSRFEVCRFDPTLEGIELPEPAYQTFKEMFLE